MMNMNVNRYRSPRQRKLNLFILPILLLVLGNFPESNPSITQNKNFGAKTAKNVSKTAYPSVASQYILLYIQRLRDDNVYQKRVAFVVDDHIAAVFGDDIFDALEPVSVKCFGGGRRFRDTVDKGQPRPAIVLRMNDQKTILFLYAQRNISLFFRHRQQVIHGIIQQIAENGGDVE